MYKFQPEVHGLFLAIVIKVDSSGELCNSDQLLSSPSCDPTNAFSNTIPDTNKYGMLSEHGLKKCMKDVT